MIEVLINFGSEMNAIQPSFARKLDLYACEINIGVQRIDGNKLEIFGIIIAFFLIKNKDKKSYFFEETFPLANISMNIALEILFFTLSNVRVNFTDLELR